MPGTAVGCTLTAMAAPTPHDPDDQVDDVITVRELSELAAGGQIISP